MYATSFVCRGARAKRLLHLFHLLHFLRRNLALAPRHTKEVAYKTLVRPQLEYAAPIWHPYNETETKKV